MTRSAAGVDYNPFQFFQRPVFITGPRGSGKFIISEAAMSSRHHWNRGEKHM